MFLGDAVTSMMHAEKEDLPSLTFMDIKCKKLDKKERGTDWALDETTLWSRKVH